MRIEITGSTKDELVTKLCELYFLFANDNSEPMLTNLMDISKLSKAKTEKVNEEEEIQEVKEVKQAKAGIDTATKPTITREDIRAKFVRLNSKGNRDELKSILDSVGADNISSIKEKDFEKIMAKLNEIGE